MLKLQPMPLKKLIVRKLQQLLNSLQVPFFYDFEFDMNMIDGEGNASAARSPTHVANADVNNNNTTTGTSQPGPSHDAPTKKTKLRRSFSQDGVSDEFTSVISSIRHGWKLLESIFVDLIIASNFLLIRQRQRRTFC